MMMTVSSLLFCQDIKRFYMSMTKLIINGLGCFFSPAVLCKLFYFIAWLKIRNTISLAIVLTIMFVYIFFFWWITEL